MQSQLTSGILPEKIRYHHLVHDIEALLQGKVEDYHGGDFSILQEHLCQHYHLSPEELSLQGFSRAYRQVIEGV